MIELCKSECKGEPTVDKGLQLLFLVWRFCKMLIIGKTGPTFCTTLEVQGCYVGISLSVSMVTSYAGVADIYCPTEIDPWL